MYSLSVTFDSNLIEKVLSPDRIVEADDEKSIVHVNKCIQQGLIRPFVADPYFSYEQIGKRERKSRTAANAHEAVSVSNEILPDGTDQIQIAISPSARYGSVELDRYRQATLEALRRMGGGNVLRTWMLGGFICANLNPDDYCTVADIGEVQRRIERCWRYIADYLQCGLTAIAKTVTPCRGKTMFEALDASEISDAKCSKLLAEYADALAISAHYGYGNQVFCTEDNGRNAITQSVMEADNKLALQKQFGIVFHSISTLSSIIPWIDSNKAAVKTQRGA